MDKFSTCFNSHGVNVTSHQSFDKKDQNIDFRNRVFHLS